MAVDTGDVAVRNATFVTESPAGVIERGTMLVRAGKIVSLGKDVAIPDGVTVVDAAGKIVTPGFFATGSTIGNFDLYAEIGDYRSGGKLLSAALDTRYGFNPASSSIAEARMEGVTAAVLVPVVGANSSVGGSLLAGQATVVDMSERADSLVKPHVAMTVDLSESAARALGGRGAALPILEALIDEAREYSRDPKAVKARSSSPLQLAEPDLKALATALRSGTPFLVVVNRASDILAVLDFASRQHIKLILRGAAEGWMVAAQIAAAGVPVLLRPDENLPETFDTLNATAENAARLERAGVHVAIEPDLAYLVPDRSPRLPAGRAVANGMTHAGALAAVTIVPARLFGVDKTLGSLEPGKRADFVIWSADPFEPSTAAEAVYIEGRSRAMVTRQTQLRDKYLGNVREAQH